jgi:hypothetical protein
MQHHFCFFWGYHNNSVLLVTEGGLVTMRVCC